MPKAAVADLTDGVGADIVIETSGFPASSAMVLDVVRKEGKVAHIGWANDLPPLPVIPIMAKTLTIFGIGGNGGRGQYERSLELVRSGRVDLAPMVTHRFSLDDSRLRHSRRRRRRRGGSIKVHRRAVTTVTIRSAGGALVRVRREPAAVDDLLRPGVEGVQQRRQVVADRVDHRLHQPVGVASIRRAWCGRPRSARVPSTSPRARKPAVAGVPSPPATSPARRVGKRLPADLQLGEQVRLQPVQPGAT